jgi:pimeloyl-ACP methyl ester carboxylesterase
MTDYDSIAPAFKLAAAGYDVWLGNQRGSKYSRRHETLDPDDKDDLKYWDFSFVEMGEYDAPA